MSFLSEKCWFCDLQLAKVCAVFIFVSWVAIESRCRDSCLVYKPPGRSHSSWSQLKSGFYQQSINIYRVDQGFFSKHLQKIISSPQLSTAAQSLFDYIPCQKGFPLPLGKFPVKRRQWSHLQVTTVHHSNAVFVGSKGWSSYSLTHSDCRTRPLCVNPVDDE